MKTTKTSQRLNQIMAERNLRQIDILNLCRPYCDRYGVKLNKSDLSQYISGKFSPKQDKLTILSMALGVSEAWLMGYDVETDHDVENLSEQEQQLVENYRSLNEEGKAKVSSYVDDLADMSKYTEDSVDAVVENGA